MKAKIILFFVVFFLLLFVGVKAQEQQGCCLNTGSAFGNKQCVTTSREQCEGRFFTGPPYDCSNIPECRPGTCIPKQKKEPCLRNKHAAECYSLGG
ncbi:MAG: hypothetical protein NZ889_01915, partial [Candidatus Pacearchaeota archaeon]|nr:hypothetical protein [Candidatus Pacearchaeota archaeon]